ncbi:MAG: hypothetical protein U9N61_02180 [Euryarchaeota archaeon]|nr:hypothetical protein [Euryarchaeota archaeon]
MVKATTIYKGKLIAEEESALPPKWKGKQKKLNERMPTAEDTTQRG